MTPMHSPTSPSFGSHPATPLTPSFGHSLDSQLSSPTNTTLRVVTTLPFYPFAVNNSPVHGLPPQSPGFGPVHRRGGSSVSTISFPSPAEAVFQHMPPTPKTPGTNVAFNTLFSPGGPVREDGRQSRMAMRSPIVERILSLPLRVNTSSARTPPSETGFPNPPNSRASTEPADDAMSICSPDSPCHPIYCPLTPVIQISAPPPPRSSSHARKISTTCTATLKATRGSNKRPRSPPPHWHLTTLPSLSSTLNNPHPQRPSYHPFPSLAHCTAYANAVTHLATPLVPLISVTTGLPHPEFPRSLLQYHLLTHSQLDSLARWYHQTEPATEESWMYPTWIPPFAAIATGLQGGSNGPSGFEDVALTTKRRRWGRFIGLRGCESPTTEQSEESLVERMEREWQRARDRAREEEIAREKGWRGRW